MTRRVPSSGNGCPCGLTSAEEWDQLNELVDQSAVVIDQPDEFNQLALAFHNAIAGASRNRVLQATLASLGQVQSIHYRDRGSPESARAAVEGHRQLLRVLRQGDAEAAREEMQAFGRGTRPVADRLIGFSRVPSSKLLAHRVQRFCVWWCSREAIWSMTFTKSAERWFQS